MGKQLRPSEVINHMVKRHGWPRLKPTPFNTEYALRWHAYHHPECDPRGEGS
jgi:hypothetical protein